MAVVAVVKRRRGCGVTRQAVMGDTDNYRRRRQTEGPAKLKNYGKSKERDSIVKKKRWHCVHHTATGGSAATGAAPPAGVAPADRRGWVALAPLHTHSGRSVGHAWQ